MYLSTFSITTFWEEEFAFCSSYYSFLLEFFFEENSECSVGVSWRKEGQKRESRKKEWKWCLRSHGPQMYSSFNTHTLNLHLAFINVIGHVTSCDIDFSFQIYFIKSRASIQIHFIRCKVNGIFCIYTNIYYVLIAFYFLLLEFKSY